MKAGDKVIIAKPMLKEEEYLKGKIATITHVYEHGEELDLFIPEYPDITYFRMHEVEPHNPSRYYNGNWK